MPDPRLGRDGGGRGQAGRCPFPVVRTTGSGCEPGSCRCWGSTPAWRASFTKRSPSPRGVRLVESFPARPARTSSSSTTCTGPTTCCSGSSSTSPTGRRDLPLLIVCTARPELLERACQLDHGGRCTKYSTPSPSDCPGSPTARPTQLISTLLDRAVLPAATPVGRSSSGSAETRCMRRSSSGACGSTVKFAARRRRCCFRTPCRR